VARYARPLEREENNPQRFLAVEEKVLGNFIQTDGVSRGTGSFGKKSSRHGFAARTIFPSDGGEKWVIDSYRAYLVYFIAEILREEETRRKEKGAHGYPPWITHREVRYIRDRSFFIVVWRIFGDSLLSTYLSSGETLDGLSMRTRVLPLRVKKSRRDRKKKKQTRMEEDAKTFFIDQCDRIDSSNRQ